MHPILFVLDFGSVERPVGTFGVMLALAVVAGTFLSVRAATRAGIDADAALAGCAVGCGGALTGGFLLDALVRVLGGEHGPDVVAAGGLTFYGAPLFGTLAVWLGARPLGYPFLRFVDVAVVAIPFAHALGRMGCFFAGCCHGAPSEGALAVVFEHPFSAAPLGVPLHPTQLYEAAGLLTLALAFTLRAPSRAGTGRRAVAYVACYAVLRILVERFRGDAIRGFVLPGVSTSDAISAVLLLLAVVFLVRTGARTPARPVAPAP